MSNLKIELPQLNKECSLSSTQFFCVYITVVLCAQIRIHDHYHEHEAPSTCCYKQQGRAKTETKLKIFDNASHENSTCSLSLSSVPQHGEHVVHRHCGTCILGDSGCASEFCSCCEAVKAPVLQLCFLTLSHWKAFPPQTMEPLKLLQCDIFAHPNHKGLCWCLSPSNTHWDRARKADRKKWQGRHKDRMC